MQDAPYREIPVLGKGTAIIAHALVDDSDYERLAALAWRLSPRGYVQTFVRGVGRRGRGVKGPGHSVYMHRLALGLVKGDGIVVDHINQNKLDNRRENLHRGTQGDNAQNRHGGYGRSSYRGVGWDGSRGKWVASAKLPGMRASKFLGRFGSEEQAAAISAAFRAEHMLHSPEARFPGSYTGPRP